MEELSIFGDDYFMRKAYQLALQAYDEDEVPVGALVVSQKRVIGSGYNQVERLKDSTAHAEMIALTAASEYLGSKYLKDCTLYVTLEPCVMCAGLIHWAQIDRVVFGASDEKKGFSKYQPSILLEKVQVESGLMENENRELLKAFFERKRSL